MSGAGLNGRAEPYVNKAIDRIIDTLRVDRNGYNNALNKGAFEVGSLCAGAAEEGTPTPSVSTLESRLFDAANEAGYVNRDGSAAAKSTIKRGLTDGARKPRDLRATLNPEKPTTRKLKKLSSNNHGEASPSASAADTEHADRDKAASALRIWNEASPIDPADESSPAVQYMRARIGDDAFTRLPADTFAWLRFHSSLAEDANKASATKHPALIARVSDTVTGEGVNSIQRIFLEPDGRSKSTTAKKARMALGRIRR